MARKISQDIRDKIVDKIKNDGISAIKAAQEFGILTSFIFVIIFTFFGNVTFNHKIIENKLTKFIICLFSYPLQEVLFSLFWLSVKNRLGETATAPDAIGLRKDWQLAAWEEDKRRHSIEVHCISLPFPFLFGD